MRNGSAEEKDEVVAAFDVFYSTSLANHLHLFQYPLRLSNRPYDASHCRLFVTNGVTATTAAGAAAGGGDAPAAASSGDGGGSGASAGITSPPGSNVATFSSSVPVLSQTSRMTMHMEVDAFGSDSFRCKTEDSHAMKREPTDDRDANSNTYRYALQSHPFVPRSDYAVGYFVNDELHLAPVSSVQQFTPVVGYHALSASGRTGALRVEDSHCSRRPDEVVGGPVGENLNRQLRKQRSVALNNDSKTEREVEFFPATSVESATVKKRLLCPTSAPSTRVLPPNARKVRHHDAYFHREAAADRNAVGGVVPSKEVVLRYAQEFTVPQQVRAAMKSAGVLSFQRIRALVQAPVAAGDTAAAAAAAAASPTATSSRVSDATLLEALRPVALFVHGAWVARISDAFKGNAAALREVVLLQLAQSPDGTVSRRELNAMITSSNPALIRSIHDILLSVATLQQGASPELRRWKLNYSDRVVAQQFAAEFPQEAAFHSAAWTKRVTAVASHLTMICSGKTVRQLYLAAEPISAASVSSRTGATAAVSPQGRTPKAASSPSSLAGAPAGAGGFSDGSVDQKIRQFTRRLFIDHGVINKMRAKELILQARETQFPDAMTQMLGPAVAEEVKQFTPATWILKVVDAPTEHYRAHLLRCALQLECFESKVLVQRANESMREEAAVKSEAAPSEIPNAIATRVISEIAEYKAGERLWHLKSGNI